MFKPTDNQWYAMVDCGMSMPGRLRDHVEYQPCCYDRKYGYFPVDPSRHVFAMAFLLDLHLGNDGTNYFENMCDRYPQSSSPLQKAADEYLDTIPGTAFRSSLSGGRMTTG